MSVAGRKVLFFSLFARAWEFGGLGYLAVLPVPMSGWGWPLNGLEEYTRIAVLHDGEG
jgi:hypothetical protein